MRKIQAALAALVCTIGIGVAASPAMAGEAAAHDRANGQVVNSCFQYFPATCHAISLLGEQGPAWNIALGWYYAFQFRYYGFDGNRSLHCNFNTHTLSTGGAWYTDPVHCYYD